MTTVAAGTTSKKSPKKTQRLQVGNRASFEGVVLRVLGGEDHPLLIMVEATGVKLTMSARWFEKGTKLRGGDHVTLAGTVTRVGESINPDAVPVSLAVDGFTASRVTVSAKWVKRAG